MPEKMKIRNLPPKVREIKNPKDIRRLPKRKSNGNQEDETFDEVEEDLEEKAEGPQFASQSLHAVSNSRASSPILEAKQAPLDARAQQVSTDTEQAAQVAAQRDNTQSERVLYTPQKENEFYQSTASRRNPVYEPLENQASRPRRTASIEASPGRAPILMPERTRGINEQTEQDLDSRNIIRPPAAMDNSDDRRYYDSENQQKDNTLMVKRRKDWRM